MSANNLYEGKKHTMIEHIENIEKLYTKVNTKNQAGWLDYVEEHLNEVKTGPYTLSHRPDYAVSSHRSVDDAVLNRYHRAKEGHPFRREEWICRLAMGQSFDVIGKIADYQVPLKTPGASDNSGLGKIDLLAANGDTLYLLEVKEPNNTESPLRAILEIYKYWKQLGGDDCRLFSRHAKVCGANKAKKALLLFESENRGSVYQKLFDREGRERLFELMKKLNVECFVGTLEDSDGERLISVRPATL